MNGRIRQSISIDIQPGGDIFVFTTGSKTCQGNQGVTGERYEIKISGFVKRSRGIRCTGGSDSSGRAAAAAERPLNCS